MAGLEVREFAEPDEVVTFEGGTIELVHIGPLVLGRETLQPGWRWSTHVKPIAGTERCEFHHVIYVLAGQLEVETRDGERRAVVAGQMADVAPGHDAWVVGSEPLVSLDLQGVVGFAKAPEPAERVLTTILFTDIVASTARAHELGDVTWRRILDGHHEDVRSLLARHGGREVKTTGDGFLLTFDAPARAVACALAIVTAAGKLGIEVRAGIHTGEVQASGGDIHGVAVHLASRIMEAADADTVLVSATTRELATGSGLRFIERGSRTFKGISGERTVYEARG